MTEKTIYIKRPCTEELPTEKGEYYTNIGRVKYELAEAIEYIWMSPKNPIWWLKPVSESKFASDFAEWCCLGNWIYDKDFKWWRQKWDGSKRKTTSELMDEFLKTYKG